MIELPKRVDSATGAISDCGFVRQEHALRALLDGAAILCSGLTPVEQIASAKAFAAAAPPAPALPIWQKMQA